MFKIKHLGGGYSAIIIKSMINERITIMKQVLKTTKLGKVYQIAVKAEIVSKKPLRATYFGNPVKVYTLKVTYPSGDVDYVTYENVPNTHLSESSGTHIFILERPKSGESNRAYEFKIASQQTIEDAKKWNGVEL